VIAYTSTVNTTIVRLVTTGVVGTVCLVGREQWNDC
jgi:hypothetical protein